MHNNRTQILKEAILLELRGHAFYTKLAESAVDKELASFFKMMATEEKGHSRMLIDELAGETGSQAEGKQKSLFDTADAILPPGTIRNLDPAGFEAAAISAAIDLETRSIELYARQAKQADSEEERILFGRLATWEEGHRTMLLAIDRDLQERFWEENNFQPY